MAKKYRRANDAELLYEQHSNLIRTIAWSWSKRFNRNVDDLIGEGDEAFMRAVRTWNPERGLFKTHLSRCLRGQIIDYLKKVDLSPDPDLLPEIEWLDDGEENRERMSEWMGTISEEGREIIRILLESPMEVLGIIGSESGRKMRGILKRHLRSEGWTYPSIWRSFKELKREIAFL